MERLFDDLLLELGQEVLDNMISRNQRKISDLDADIAGIVASISLIETGDDNAGFRRSPDAA